MDKTHFRALTLNETQQLFRDIYGAVNEERFGLGLTRGVSSMWLRVVRHAGEVARAIRKDDDPLLICELPQLLCWYCSFCDKLGISLEEIIWRYFPYVCPTCYAEMCICGPRKEQDQENRPKQKDPALLDQIAARNAGRRPFSLDDYVSMFERIYGGHNEAAHIDGIFLHLMEELGEVAKLIHILKHLDRPAQARIRDVEMSSELADVFSWICKLWGNADARMWRISEYFELKMPDMKLSSLIEMVYKRGCPECHREQCASDCPGWNTMNGGDRLVTL